MTHGANAVEAGTMPPRIATQERRASQPALLLATLPHVDQGDEERFESLGPVGEREKKDADTAGDLALARASADSRTRPTPHKAKLVELLNNRKLPAEDRTRVEAALHRYTQWIADMQTLAVVGDAKVLELVRLLNEYKRTVEINLIWDSSNDFLFRQRGQIKIDNSIVEEFLPWLVDMHIIPELKSTDCFAGPAAAFAAAYFSSTLTGPSSSIGLRVRRKDQDFTLSRRAHLTASFDPTFPIDQSDKESVWLAYLAAECKTNLDKTMFQEATATAHDLKIAMPAARYYLVSEFLDMRPISTAGTDIDEVLILRGKRLASNKRSEYATAAARTAKRDEFIDYLEANPVREHVVMRFVEHLKGLFAHRDPDEADVASRGYF